METTKIRMLLQTIAKESITLRLLREDPERIKQRFSLDDEEVEALRSADLLRAGELGIPRNGGSGMHSEMSHRGALDILNASGTGTITPPGNVLVIGGVSIAIHRISFMRDGFTGEMDWNSDILGLNVSMINIEIAASGALASIPSSAMPGPIPVQVTSRLPNGDAGTSTISGVPTLIWSVPVFGADPTDPSHTLYRLSRPIADAGPFLTPAPGGPLKVATVVRPGGTSDAQFRSALGTWSPRGRSTQPTNVGPGGTRISTGNPKTDLPDAFTLLQAGGVEVLDVAIVHLPNLHAWRLVRSTAAIFYYSGHGLGASNCLAIEAPPGSHTYACWASATDLTSPWPAAKNLNVFIIAGCSVLGIDFSTSPPTGPGLAWGNLLTSKAGPLKALLGYQASAPADNPVGNAIATEMATRIAGGSVNYVKDWLDINANHRAWNAAALEPGNYWWITKALLGFSYTLHSHAIP